MASLENIKKALAQAGVYPYQSRYFSSPKDMAQEQLSNRTHYADDSTLRFFGARINETRQDDNGLWFALRESLEKPGVGRIHRWAIFDVFGTCERTEDCKTAKQADKLFDTLKNVEWEAYAEEKILKLVLEKQSDAIRIMDALTGK